MRDRERQKERERETGEERERSYVKSDVGTLKRRRAV
jgi:hypothetical protein